MDHMLEFFTLSEIFQIALSSGHGTRATGYMTQDKGLRTQDPGLKTKDSGFMI
jgi:hypothetical protein